MIKVLLIAYPVMFCQGLKKVLSSEKDIVVKKEVVSGEQAIENINREDYDVIVLEILIPELNGLEILQQIKNLKPSAKVLMLSLRSNQSNAVQAYKRGAAGYLSMNETTSELMSAIRKVANDGVYVSSNMAEKLVSSLSEPISQPRIDILSKREYQVFLKLATGRPQNKIAMDLGVRLSTVSTLRKRILVKLGLKNNYELIRLALREKIIG